VGLVTRNVATLVDPPRVVRPEFHSFSPEETARFLAGLRGHRLEALYATALALGLRWADIDLERKTLRVRYALQWLRGDQPQLVAPKTRQSKRTLPLPALVIAQLKPHRVRQLEERLKAGEE